MAEKSNPFVPHLHIKMPRSRREGKVHTILTNSVHKMPSGFNNLGK